MSDVVKIVAEKREGAGTGSARAVRRAGRIPAIIYGGDSPPIMISVNAREIGRESRRVRFFSQIYEVAVNGDAYQVLARDVQFHPVSDNVLHVDFFRFRPDSRIRIGVAVVFENEEESPGIKRGGVLNIVRHEVELLCPVLAIPESICIDLTGLEISDSVHISGVTLPDNVTPTITDRDFTIATVAAPTVIRAEAAEEAAEAEEAEGEEEVEGEEEAAEESEE